MDNKIWKFGFVGALLFGAGYLVGMYTTKVKYEKILFQIEESKEYKPQSSEVESQTPESDSKNEEKAKMAKEKEALSKLANIYGEQKEEHIDYHKVMEEAKVRQNIFDYSEPYIITSQDFDLDTDYEKETLHYYHINDILTNEDETVYAERDDHVGDDFINHFGKEIANTVFVRNDDIRTDFEIVKVNDDYYDYLEKQ